MAGAQTKTLLKTPPAPHEVEVSVFGPGFGECILVHLGFGNWIVIDSCVDPDSKSPVALTYFEKIGVDPATAVKKIIASHWHDDHIRGLGEIFKACISADFICSGALSCDEFLKLIMGSQRRMIPTSGVDELCKVADELARRASERRERYHRPIWAVAERLILKESHCEIHTLSPSDTAILMAKRDFVDLLPHAHLEPKRRILPFTKNRAAVVLHISVFGHSILLGADLEERGDPHDGWSAIISSTARPQAKASAFKVPHHGSENAYHSAIWSTLLVNAPVSVLTPYSKGNRPLPTEEGISKLCSHTDKLFATAIAGKSGSVRRNKTVERTIKENFKSLRKVYTARGHVRLRATQGSQWQVELFGVARVLCNRPAA